MDLEYKYLPMGSTTMGSLKRTCFAERDSIFGVTKSTFLAISSLAKKYMEGFRVKFNIKVNLRITKGMGSALVGILLGKYIQGSG